MHTQQKRKRLPQPELKMQKFLFFVLTAASCCSVVLCQDMSDSKIPKLRDLLDKTRMGKQFQLLDQHDGKSGASVSETNIAMSLVDALQKWADALEAQISMMRDEVAVLKTSNNHLTDKVSSLEMDNVKLSDEVGHLNKKVDNLSGKMDDVHTDMSVVEGLKDDIVVMSSSFGEFLGHFNNYSLAVMSNYSSVADELSSTVSSIRGLYSTITAMTADSQTLSRNLSSTMIKISTHMSDMESGLGLYKNFTLHRIENIEKEIETMTVGMVNRTMVEKLVAHFSEEITEVKVSSSNNFSVISTEVKGMATAFHQTLYNASFLIFTDVEEVKSKADKLAFEMKDLKSADQTLQNDLMTVSTNLEFVASTNEDRWRSTELKLAGQVNKLEDLSTALINIDNRLRDTESIVPSFNKMNVSLSEFLGSLRSNVSQLDQTASEMKSGMFKMESQLMMNEMTSSANTNATLSLQTRVRKLEENIADVQGKMIDLQTNVVDMADSHRETSKAASHLRGSVTTLESGLMELGRITKKGEINSTMLQLGYRGLERHYVELKRDLFETQLQMVSLNQSLNSIGEVRQDLVSVGLAMANTTSFLTKRIDEVSTFSGLIKEDVNQMSNQTHFIDEKLQRFIYSYNHTSGNMLSSVTKLRDELGKTHNRTAYLEFGLSGIMNYSLEMEGSLKNVQENLSGCLQAIHFLNLNASDFSVRFEYVDKVQAEQSELISTNANHIQGNVSRLSLAANLLETELSRVASSYNRLKHALSNQIQSSGIMEVSIQKMTQESTVIKAELDSIKFTLTSVRTETSGVSVFVTSMQTHLNELTSNMSGMAQNFSTAMNEIEDMREHLATVDNSIGNLNTNLSATVSSLGSSTDHIEALKGNMTTIKTNLVGLGNYINNINGDLSQLLVSFDGYAKKMGTEMSFIKGNMSEMSADMTGTKKFNIDLKKQVETVEFMATSVRNDVTGLTTKIYNIKTSLFEQTNDISAVKVSQEQIKVTYHYNQA